MRTVIPASTSEAQQESRTLVVPQRVRADACGPRQFYRTHRILLTADSKPWNAFQGQAEAAAHLNAVLKQELQIRLKGVTVFKSDDFLAQFSLSVIQHRRR